MKIFKLILKILLIIVLLLGVVVGILLYELSDKSFNEPDYLKTLEPTKIDGKSMVSRGLKDCKTTGAISLTFEEKEMNGLLKSLRLELNKQMGDDVVIETMYVDVKDGHDAMFVSYLDLHGFKTSIKGDFEIELSDGIFSMKIENITLGKMNFKSETVSSILHKFVNSESLVTNLEMSGFKLNVNLNNFTISFDMKDLKMLISNTEENDADLYQTLIDVFFRIEDLISISEKSKELGVQINLNSFEYDENVDASMPYELDFNSIIEKTETLINSSIIESKDADKVSTYLVKGYSNSDQEIKDYIIDIDLNSIGIDDTTNYVGIVPNDDKSIEESFVQQIPELTRVSNFEGFVLEERTWNDFFSKSNAVGKVYTFAREENSEIKLSYIAIETMYIDIKNDHFALYLVASVNGERISINFELDSKPTDGLRISSSVESMRIGTNSLIDNEIKELLAFLSKSINDKWIIVNSEEKKMDFDFSLLFNNSEEMMGFMEYFASTHTSFVEKNNEGYTLINPELNLGI